MHASLRYPIEFGVQKNGLILTRQNAEKYQKSKYLQNYPWLQRNAKKRDIYRKAKIWRHSKIMPKRIYWQNSKSLSARLNIW